MARIDIRSERDTKITEIVFADHEDGDDITQAYRINSHLGPHLTIHDDITFVTINSKQHALDLIKALEKAIELEWIK